MRCPKGLRSMGSYRKCHNTPSYSLLVTPKFCISIVFSWGRFNSQEKLKTMLMYNFWVTNKEYNYGMLWHFLLLSIDDPLKNGRLVRLLAASLFSSRSRRFWITWNHLSNCRGLRPVEPDRGVASRKSEVRSKKWKVRSLTMQHWVWTVRNQKSEVRTLSSLKYEVGS